MNIASYGHGSSISETLDIVERGLRRLGITGYTARPVRLASGIECENKRPKPITPEDVTLMRHLTAEGVNQAEIARRIGCTQSTVSKTLTRLGICQRRGRKQRV
jgi:DNA-binding NarL/FixJ family response regulator